MNSGQLLVPRTARYSYIRGDGDEVWFVLHGYAQLAADFLSCLKPLGKRAKIVVAPEALSRFSGWPGNRSIGASWMTSEMRNEEITDYVRYLDLLHKSLVRTGLAPPGKVNLLGFSQGTSTACRWLELGTIAVNRLVLWAGDVPPELTLGQEEARIRTAAIHFIVGDDDRFLSAERLRAETSRLDAAQIPYTVHRYAGKHEIDTIALQNWLATLT